MPLLQEIGQFGSLRSPEAGAPRYVSTKLHENFRLLYKDFELLSPRYEEGSQIEPEYFLPIIPTVLLNGSSGIAVGFATNILNRNPLDLIQCCLNHLDGKRFKEPAPWINGFDGEVISNPESENSWLFRGKYVIKNTTTVDITELPPSITYEKFDNYLNGLEDDRKIAGYINNCKSDINYTLKMSRSTLSGLQKGNRLKRFLKMEEKQTENFTVLDEDGKLRIFNSASDIIKHFVDFRMQFYTKRKEFLIEKLERELTYLSNRAKFIKMIIDGSLKVNNVPKNTIIASLEKEKFDKIDGTYSYLLLMPIHTLTKEKYQELLQQESDKKNELVEMKKRKPVDMYKEDLNELKKVLKKEYS
jgi:DNA topoisomerase-2